MKIKFKAKIMATDTWVYGCGYKNGYLLQDDGHDDVYWHSVDHKTVGQYIGKKDIHGVKIYCGDRIQLTCNCCFYEIIWDKKTMSFFPKDDGSSQVHGVDIDVWDHKLIVYGNIHDEVQEDA